MYDREEGGFTSRIGLSRMSAPAERGLETFYSRAALAETHLIPRSYGFGVASKHPPTLRPSKSTAHSMCWSHAKAYVVGSRLGDLGYSSAVFVQFELIELIAFLGMERMDSSVHERTNERIRPRTNERYLPTDELQSRKLRIHGFQRTLVEISGRDLTGKLGSLRLVDSLPHHLGTSRIRGLLRSSSRKLT